MSLHVPFEPCTDPYPGSHTKDREDGGHRGPDDDQDQRESTYNEPGEDEDHDDADDGDDDPALDGPLYLFPNGLPMLLAVHLAFELAGRDVVEVLVVCLLGRPGVSQARLASCGAFGGAAPDRPPGRPARPAR